MTKLSMEIKLKKHIDGHQLEKGYSKVISKGKVKASNTKSTSDEPKERKPATAYRIFLNEMRPVVRNQHPDATPQEMIKLLNEAWNKEKAEGKKDLWPGKVLKVSTKCVRVMFYDKSRTIEDKNHAHIIPFSTDISVCEGRGSVWVKAWKEAKWDLEKRK